MAFPSLDALIGNTPLVKLHRLGDRYVSSGPFDRD